ncbi:MAG: hypothetical protein PHP69_04735 [Candidatus Omnitrophica bacterium]|jgi:hypothetical protein|nr:hypothetical protein [Candidatus Omnitrophota bacterium]MDD5081512.1 hypothetical protein [Candidatus Omnitrophota bacterium]MDD5441217.1 hypothetical protein [Candidatus Omnitrophota bacterium]
MEREGSGKRTAATLKGTAPFIFPFQEKLDGTMGGIQVSRGSERENKNVGAVLVLPVII